MDTFPVADAEFASVTAETPRGPRKYACLSASCAELRQEGFHAKRVYRKETLRAEARLPRTWKESYVFSYK